jgi:hypothetical protein
MLRCIVLTIGVMAVLPAAVAGLWGQKQTFRSAIVMSALPPKADMCSALAYVCFGPIADIACSEMREAANGGIVQIVIFLA